jgi:WhiB family redox-sensing transcriptional regulator
MTIVAVEAARGTADPLVGNRRTRVLPVTSTTTRVRESLVSSTPIAVELMTVTQLERVVAAAPGKPCSITSDPDAWFPALGNQPYTPERDAEQQREAARLCGGCPVKAACLRWSLEDPRGEFGVWGGQSEWTRRRMRAELVESRAVASSEVRATGQLTGVQL